MRNYRAYVVDRCGRIVGSHVIDAENDERAVEIAGRYVDDCEVAVCELMRAVARLRPAYLPHSA